MDKTLFYTNGKLKQIQFSCPYRRTCIAIIDCEEKALHLMSTKSEKIKKIQEKLKAQYTEKEIESLIVSIENQHRDFSFPSLASCSSES